MSESFLTESLKDIRSWLKTMASKRRKVDDIETTGFGQENIGYGMVLPQGRVKRAVFRQNAVPGFKSPPINIFTLLLQAKRL
ncbi:hypothetical protein [Neisseria dentiae]|uniref:hypothetical protein n=1 Tax=Neisseria dentiae TaxID=194197 RepID=UPI0035A1989A